MAKTEFTSVDEYIAAQPESVQGILGRVCSSIRKAVPAAQEIISYKMPTYTLGGARLLYFAVWNQHYSIYAVTEKVVAAFRDELASYEVKKGTIRFPLSEPVPEKLIGCLAKFRATEVAERENAKMAVPRKEALTWRTIHMSALSAMSESDVWNRGCDGLFSLLIRFNHLRHFTIHTRCRSWDTHATAALALPSHF